MSLSPAVRHLVLAALAAAGCVGVVEGEGTPSPAPASPAPGAPMSVPPGGSPASPAAPMSTPPGAPPSAPLPPPAPGAPVFQCNEAQSPPETRMRRLTNTQYRNTLKDLFTFALGGDAAGAASVMNEIGNALGKLPRDVRAPVAQDIHGAYRRMDQDLHQIHVDGAYEVGLAAGAALSRSTRLAKVVGTCATDADAANDDACIASFVDRFGERALRRPLGADEKAFLRKAYAATGIDAAGIADVVAVVLNMPPFLYLMEHGEAEVPGRKGAWRLGPYELASRLSYQFWQTMPDEALWQAAKTGELATAAGWTRQVDRLFRDPRTRDTVDEFFTDWWKLSDVKSLEDRATDPVFKAFAGLDLPGKTLRQSVIDDALDLVRHFTWTRPSGYAALLTTEQSFARGADLARIYGVAPWDGAGEPPALPLGVRPGLLTRAAFVASTSANTRPIMKGVFIREHILCDTLPPPPANANNDGVKLSGNLSTRQVVERLTEKEAACAGCHANLINPLGFVTENFDALGRVRPDQRLFDDKGTEIARVPIDTRTVPQVVGGDMRPAANAADLSRLILESGKGQACLARSYVRFTFARWDEPERDGCALERVRRALDGNGTIQDALRAIALSPDFQQRVFP